MKAEGVCVPHSSWGTGLSAPINRTRRVCSSSARQGGCPTDLLCYPPMAQSERDHLSCVSNLKCAGIFRTHLNFSFCEVWQEPISKVPQQMRTVLLQLQMKYAVKFLTFSQNKRCICSLLTQPALRGLQQCVSNESLSLKCELT